MNEETNPMNEPSVDQRAFWHVKEHLLAQDRQSIAITAGPATMCAYRGRDGLKCAVGCLIPDSVYDPSMEGISLVESGAVHPKTLAIHTAIGLDYPGVNYAMLAQLQQIHDNDALDAWSSALKRVALAYDLQYDRPA